MRFLVDFIREVTCLPVSRYRLAGLEAVSAPLEPRRCGPGGGGGGNDHPVWGLGSANEGLAQPHCPGALGPVRALAQTQRRPFQALLHVTNSRCMNRASRGDTEGLCPFK